MSKVQTLDQWIKSRDCSATKVFEITFEYPHRDWIWFRTKARDFHHAISQAIAACPEECRVQNVREIL